MIWGVGGCGIQNVVLEDEGIAHDTYTTPIEQYQATEG